MRVPARILAIDYGKKRIGLAVSDPLGIAAHGLDTLFRTRLREDLETLAAIVDQREVELILFGNPLRLDGTDSAASGSVRRFAHQLQRRTGRPVEFWDERLTSFEAEQLLREMQIPTGRHTGNLDRMAAMLLLRSYLEARSA